MRITPPSGMKSHQEKQTLPDMKQFIESVRSVV